MITGTVQDLRVLVGVTFRLPNQPNVSIECVVDTGFEGALALPLQVECNIKFALSRVLDTQAQQEFAKFCRILG